MWQPSCTECAAASALIGSATSKQCLPIPFLVPVPFLAPIPLSINLRLVQAGSGCLLYSLSLLLLLTNTARDPANLL